MKKNIFRSEDAQVMVEFMLVFPVFLLLVMGIIEFSLLSLAHQNVNLAAFKAARAEIVGMKPMRSAWVSLYMLTPHWVDGISPFDAYKIQNPTFNQFDFSINNKWKVFEFAIDSPCLLQIFGTGDSLVSFGGIEFKLFDKQVRNFEDFINALGNFILGEASSLMNSAIGEVNDVIGNAGYALPPLVRKVLYALAFTEVNVTEINDADAPSVKVEVTYYYILKFPVVETLFQYLIQNYPVTGMDTGKVYTGTGNKWAKAEELSRRSGLTFIPITHSCTLGNEKKMIPNT
jgi:hypothetical protein